jgi:hypothetical protein
MTLTTGLSPVIDLNAIRTILYLGLKGDVALPVRETPDAAARAAETPVRAAAQIRRAETAPGIDTWA